MQYRRGIPKQPNNNDKKYLKIWPRTCKGSGPFLLCESIRRRARGHDARGRVSLTDRLDPRADTDAMNTEDPTPLEHPPTGTVDDDDDRDDEHANENEAFVREQSDRTESPEEFEIDDEDAPG